MAGRTNHRRTDLLGWFRLLAVAVGKCRRLGSAQVSQTTPVVGAP